MTIIRDNDEWALGRIDIPNEFYSGTESQIKVFAQGEVYGGYGLDRGDMFLTGPDGTLYVPHDRTDGTGPVTWVPAGEEFKAELAESDWDTGLLL